MSRGKSSPDWMRVPACLLAAVGLSSGVAAFAGEKVQLSNPDKGPVLPPKEVDHPGRDRAPFDFFDRGNSVGGVVDTPSATPAAGPGDPRAQRKLIEVLEKQKGWAQQDGGSLDARANDFGKDADASDPTWDNFEEHALSEGLSGRGRRNGELELDDSSRADDSQADRRRSDDDSGRRDQSRRGGSARNRDAKDSSRGDHSAEDGGRAPTAGGTPGFGERVQFSDPFSTSGNSTAEAGVRSPFDVGSSRSAARLAEPAAVAAVEERQQQFRQLLGGDDPKSGLDGLGLSRSAAERNSEFHALLTGAPGTAGAVELGLSSPLEATKPAASVLAPPKSSLPSALAPAPSAGSGFALPAPPAPAAPAAAKQQPPILPFPKRSF